jgi:hypothetical protein
MPGTSLAVAHVTPASTGSITPVFVNIAVKSAFSYTITHLSSISPRRQRETSPLLPRPTLCPQSSADSGSFLLLLPRRSYRPSTSLACIPCQDTHS